MRIDLHIHSTASDGTLSPTEILTRAATCGLGAIAITDHDTVAGVKKALGIERPPSLHFLSGVEISVSPLAAFQDSGTFHILGYGIDVNDPVLTEALNVLQAARRSRNPKIIDRLNALGVDITMAEVIEDAGDTDQIGRPHIARLMVKKGLVPSIDDAFQSYLAVGGPAYVSKYRLDCDGAIDIIRSAGGIAVLAHPFLLRLKGGVTLEDFVATLKSMGLGGIEAHYPAHSPDQTAEYIDIADRQELLITGGTDFHGSLKPDIQMGTGTGDFSVSYALYEKMAAGG